MGSINVYFLSTGDRQHAHYVAHSFKKHHDCKVLQFTDMKGEMLNGVDEVIHKPYSGHMVHFMIECFATIKDKEFITTADDVIINAPLDEALEGDDEVVICKYDDPKTKRRNKRYTNGLVVVRHPEFYPDCLEELNRLGVGDPSLLDWWGDLDCIENVIDSGKYKVRFLPENKYCRIPKGNGDGNSTAVLWHYYGNRKMWMEKHGVWQETIKKPFGGRIK